MNRNRLEKLSAYILLLLGSAYLVWHLGRLYEYNRISDRLTSAIQENSTDSFYYSYGDIRMHTVTDDLDIIEEEGVLEAGRCFNPSGEIVLLDYYRPAGWNGNTPEEF